MPGFGLLLATTAVAVLAFGTVLNRARAGYAWFDALVAPEDDQSVSVDDVLRTVWWVLTVLLVLSDGTQLKVWDVGGRRDVREHWRAHYAKVQAIIFVIDAVDRHRLQENSIELRRLLDQPKLVGLPLLLLANKQDVAGALPASEIEACLHLGTIRDRAWNCMGCSAFRGDGFVRGLKWLASQAGRSPTTDLRRFGSGVGQEDSTRDEGDEDDEGDEGDEDEVEEQVFSL